LKIIDAGDKRAIARLLTRDGRGDRTLEAQVRAIVEKVRTGGDRAVLQFARKFDGAVAPLEITRE